MEFNLNSFLMGVSTALDLSEQEILKTNTFHSKRVAYISVRIAKELALNDEECFDLVSLAIMHDNGLTEAVLNGALTYKDTEFKALEEIKDHCRIGEKNIENFPFLTNPKNVILYHHEHCDGSGFYEKNCNEIPLMAKILSFSDEIEFKFDLCDYSKKNKKSIKDFSAQNVGKLFDENVVRAFMKISDEISFWLDMQEVTLNQSLTDYIPEISIDIDWKEILKITKVFSQIIDSKSKFTYKHTRGLIEKIERMSSYYNFDEEKIIKLKIAASLHDLGKLAVSNKILEKDGPLDQDEFEDIKIHTYFTHFTLRNLKGFHEIERWAYCHHEKLDGSGYPYGFSAEELGFEERLMGCLDIYQALTEDRPYRNGMNHNEAIMIMEAMVEKSFIDAVIVNDIKQFFMESKT